MSEHKPKILFVITKGTWGGAQKYVYELATSFSRDFEVVVAYGTGGILSQRLQEKNIKTIHISSLGRDINPLLDISSFFSLCSIFRKEKPDIVHLNSSKIGGLGALAGRIAGIKKIIFTAHGWAFNEDLGIISKSVIWILSWLTALLATGLIVLGEKERKQTIDMPMISHKKVSLIRLGIASPQFLDRQTSRNILAGILKKPKNFFDGKTIVGTIAELVPNKGISYVLEAFKNLPDIFYIVIGNGDLKNSFRQKIEELHLEERVFLTGFIQDAETLLKAFDVFLLPSLKEGLPYTLLQAGLAELPVVATRVGAIPELIRDRESGLLIQRKNPEEIIQALQTLLNNNEMRSHCSVNLSQKIQQEFSKEKMLGETWKVYTS